MITKRKKPAPMPLRGTTTRDRRPTGAPSRTPSTRRRAQVRREHLRGLRERSAGVRARIGILETALHAALSFAGTALVVSCVASLFGNVLLESARRGTIETQGRVRAETAARESLKGQLSASASTEAIDRWATEHGFLGAEEISAAPALPTARGGRALVARR